MKLRKRLDDLRFRLRFGSELSLAFMSADMRRLLILAANMHTLAMRAEAASANEDWLVIDWTIDLREILIEEMITIGARHHELHEALYA